MGVGREERGRMKFGKLKAILQGKKEFHRIEDWNATPITIGSVSPNVYRMQKGPKDYYVKEINEGERKSLLVLTAIRSRLIPSIVYPDLLDRRILVFPYLGPCLRPKAKLEPRLFWEYAGMQNALNNPGVRRKLRRTHDYRWSDGDNGWFSRGYARGISGCLPWMKRFRRRYRLRELETWVRAFTLMAENAPLIALEYSRMPFGRLHGDFREDNIVGKPQRLADWCSSYERSINGHGPFMHDVGPYLACDKRARLAFVGASDICRKAAPHTVDRWIWLASCIHLWAKANMLIPDNGRMEYSTEVLRRFIRKHAWLCRIVLSHLGRPG